MINPGEIHIHDGNWQQYVHDPVIDGEQRKRGLVPRDYETHPIGCYGAGEPFSMPLIPRSEWSERIKDMEGMKSRLSDMRMKGGPNGGMIPSRDQNGRGYCWIHSGTSAVLFCRARDNQPYVDLSAYAGACIIKSYRDEGGWGAQGVDWICENGMPDSKYWPQKSTSRSNDTQEMRANAKLHRISEGFWEVSDAQYDRNLTFDQVMTCLMCRIPVVVDFNWWGHSVCAADPVIVSNSVLYMESGKKATLADMELAWGATDGYGERIWNSWSDSWSQQGMGVLSGSKAIPNGATAPRVVDASTA